jgi:putative flavoprotein involved in K+ transport
MPRVAQKLPARIMQLHSCDYVNPESLPPGDILIVGTGQSGCQIAEDLHLTGRRVHLCVGDAPRVARTYRGKDVVEWLDHMKYYDLPVDKHPLGTGVRDKTNHYVTGRDGGRDIDLRKFALEGMQLYGRFDDIVDGVAAFGADLKNNLDGADAVSESIKDSIDKFIAANSIDAPVEARYVPLWEPPADVPQSLDLETGKIAVVIWCIGFRTDFSWIGETIFDERGYPNHDRGVTDVPGLYFLGLPWQYTWGSGRFSGIARDAQYLAEKIVSAAGETDAEAMRIRA